MKRLLAILLLCAAAARADDAALVAAAVPDAAEVTQTSYGWLVYKTNRASVMVRRTSDGYLIDGKRLVKRSDGSAFVGGYLIWKVADGFRIPSGYVRDVPAGVSVNGRPVIVRRH